MSDTWSYLRPGERFFIDRRRIMNQNPNLYCYVPTFLWIVASRHSIFASKWFEIYTPERWLGKSFKNINLLTILTSLISEKPRIKMLTNISVAASRLSVKLIVSALQWRDFTEVSLVGLARLALFPWPGWKMTMAEDALQPCVWLSPRGADPRVISLGAENVIQNRLLHAATMTRLTQPLTLFGLTPWNRH